MLVDSDKPISGYYKRFLSEKLKNKRDIVICSRKDKVPISNLKKGVLYYTNAKTASVKEILGEFLSFVEMSQSRMLDFRNIEENQEYKDFVSEERKALRLKRQEGKINNGLNKKQGDITIGFGRASKMIMGAVYEKVAVPIKDLYKLPHIIVYSTEKTQDFDDFTAMVANVKSIRSCLIGKLEAKKLPELKKIIKFNPDMPQEIGKMFGKMCSAALFEEELKKYGEISSKTTSEYFSLINRATAIQMELQKYVNDYLPSFPNKEVKEDMVNVAIQNKLLDKQLWDKYMELKELNNRYSFIKFLTVPKYYDERLKKEYSNMLSQMLLFRRKHFKEIDNMEISIQAKTSKKREFLIVKN